MLGGWDELSNTTFFRPSSIHTHLHCESRHFIGVAAAQCRNPSHRRASAQGQHVLRILARAASEPAFGRCWLVAASGDDGDGDMTFTCTLLVLSVCGCSSKRRRHSSGSGWPCALPNEHPWYLSSPDSRRGHLLAHCLTLSPPPSTACGSYSNDPLHWRSSLLGRWLGCQRSVTALPCGL